MNKKAVNYILEIIVGSLMFITWMIMFWLTCFHVEGFDSQYFLVFNELFLPLIIGYLTHATLSAKRKEVKNE